MDCTKTKVKPKIFGWPQQIFQHPHLRVRLPSLTGSIALTYGRDYSSYACCTFRNGSLGSKSSLSKAFVVTTRYKSIMEYLPKRAFASQTSISKCATRLPKNFFSQKTCAILDLDFFGPNTLSAAQYRHTNTPRDQVTLCHDGEAANSVTRADTINCL